MAHAAPEKCPFCLENGKVEILAETEDGYLTYVLDGRGERMELRFFIIPKEPIEDFYELPDAWMETMKYLFRELYKLLEWADVSTDDLEHWNLNLNNGKRAGQRVKHLHFWIIFRVEPTSSAASEVGLAGLIEKVNQQQDTLAHMRESLAACLH